ncbi:MAG: hypothetical protein AAF502_19580 [Bacteroidota bacterium]
MKTDNKNRTHKVKNSDNSKPPAPEAINFPRQSRTMLGYNEPLMRD